MASNNQPVREIFGDSGIDWDAMVGEVGVGRTCQQQKRLSDATLDRWAHTILVHLPLNCRNADSLSSFDHELQFAVIEYCDPVGQVRLDVDFDEGLSRHNEVSSNDLVWRQLDM